MWSLPSETCKGLSESRGGPALTDQDFGNSAQLGVSSVPIEHDLFPWVLPALHPEAKGRSRPLPKSVHFGLFQAKSVCQSPWFTLGNKHQPREPAPGVDKEPMWVSILVSTPQRRKGGGSDRSPAVVDESSGTQASSYF